MKTTLIVSLIAAAFLTACGKAEVDFGTLETARATARANASLNARKWRADTKSFADLNLNERGDSSQVPACPQGDGWATIDLIDGNGQKSATLKCSTVSMSVGCRTEQDYKSSPFANEDGQCAPLTRVPHPLPKLAS